MITWIVVRSAPSHAHPHTHTRKALKLIRIRADSFLFRLRITFAIYLSTDMQTSTKLDKYRPNVRKNDIKRHIKSPAFHDTVHAHPISNGIMIKVTSKSAMAKCVNIVSIRDGRLWRRFSNSTNTVILPIDESTIRTLHRQ